MQPDEQTIAEADARFIEWMHLNLSHAAQHFAEVMTLLPGDAVSPSNQLQAAVDLPDAWWAQLRHTIDILRATPTIRVYADQARSCELIRNAFGTDLHVQEWETVHGDLHWENLLAPDFGLLDWEMWGLGPAGTDAATLLLYSLLVPEIAERVHDTFADVLDSEAGRQAQLTVAARLMSRIDSGDNPELAEPPAPTRRWSRRHPRPQVTGYRGGSLRTNIRSPCRPPPSQPALTSCRRSSARIRPSGCTDRSRSASTPDHRTGRTADRTCSVRTALDE